MALPTRITLPPSGRPVGGLLSAARPIGGDWWRGVTFSSGQCLAPQAVGSCTDGAVTKTLAELSDAAQFDAFAVLQGLRCSTMGRPELKAYAEASLDVTREFAVTSELLTGAASGNPSLKDAAELVTSSTPGIVEALACIDQFAATTLSGRLAFIHVSPLAGTHLLSESAIRLDGRRFLTAFGNVVVIASGYDGRAPVPGSDPSVPASEGDPQWLYATGEVYAEVGQRDYNEAVERGQNTLEAIAEDAALVAFDPCFNVAIETTLETCGLVAS